MAEHHYKFNVAMSCGGCSGAVERVLKRLDGEKRNTTSLPRGIILYTLSSPFQDPLLPLPFSPSYYSQLSITDHTAPNQR